MGLFSMYQRGAYEMKNISSITIILFLYVYAISATAQIAELKDELGDSYYYVGHFEVTINKP